MQVWLHSALWLSTLGFYVSKKHILIFKCHCHDKSYFYECMQSFLLRPNPPPAVVGILYKDIVVLMYMDILRIPDGG